MEGLTLKGENNKVFYIINNEKTMPEEGGGNKRLKYNY